VTCRARLRSLLAAYIGASPDALRFEYGERGKPALADEPGLHFNLAHADELAVVAVTRLEIVGVDVERLGSIPEALEIARHHFAPSERSRLAFHPPGERAEPFLVCWTRKEAFVKALGDGLSHALDQFEVSLDASERHGLLRIDGDAAAAAAWTVRTWWPADRYVASVAVRAADALVLAVRPSMLESPPR
jgi:4'-phosphopantetheinyl transferase